MTTELIKPGYDDRLTNQDLAPLRKQTWGSYNIFAFWMSDVHSVGGYVTAGSLFALGLSSWQVLFSLLAGITIVYFFCNLVAKPSQRTGVPYPVICRTVFGVLGANVPAIIRGAIAVAWYGIQTYLASAALDVVVLKLFPSLLPWADVDQHGFLGLPVLGWGSYAVLWLLQAAVFWTGMETIRKFIDFCGPAVYVVMIALAGYLIWKAGWGHIDLSLGEVKYHGFDAVPIMLGAIALVVSYFSGPMLNFGDFSRYGKSFRAVRTGNLLGLPVNFLAFSILVVVTSSLTIPVFGELITDPVATVARIDSTFAIVLGALTFAIATIGINIVANFISPAFDFSNVSPQRISWRAGGMIAAVGSVLITPWNLYNNPDVIHYTLETLGAFIGPLFGVLIADYYLVKKQQVVVDDLFTMSPEGRYFYRNGYNPPAIIATAIGAIVAVVPVLWTGGPGMHTTAQYSWFIGMGLGFMSYLLMAARSRSTVPQPRAEMTVAV
ncbi:NCS1 family nucleobase:cation symporter-1 [Actinoplanes sp. N902-109]|uniref:NCS1 family nucleobase:cation symporter-1 n=1 Tax=Actinoplanes sp. (strain N902-109) TaxID=649831 RepID=UPI00032961F6|nr:NCS1 family nucleobase:cation symporter-1 [Actinoplanes sp. N902-109]AGL14752.1 permease, cytosine/purine, uracil, thiamine, allantoin family [Actinoplanes sp. N902-109]